MDNKQYNICFTNPIFQNYVNEKVFLTLVNHLFDLDI